MKDEMNMVAKKYLPYIGVLILGIVLGMVFLGDRQDSEMTSEQIKTSYSCSMHPQIQSETEGSCPLCGMDLVAASGQETVSGNQFKMKKEAVALANIQTMPIEATQPEVHSLVLSGVIRPNEKTNSIQTTLFDGRIDRLDVNFVGEYVRKGQQIGLIYSPELYLAQDKLLTSSSYKDTHVKLYKAARNGLGLWKLTDEQIDEILRTGEPMVNFPLLADVSGTVTEILATEGNYYKQGDPLFKLSNLNTVWAVFDAYESQVPYLSVGQKVEIRPIALKGKSLEGKIDFIEPVFDKVKRTVAVRVDLNNRAGLLKPGMFVEAEVSARATENGVWVPKTAVLWTGKRSVVYRKAHPQEPIFEIAEVKLGETAQLHYEVLEGLEVGDEIVVNGTFTVDAAAQLSRKKSMMLPGTENSPETYRENIKEISYNSQLEETVHNLITSYLELKEALVDTDGQQAKAVAVEQVEIIDQVNYELLDSQQSARFTRVTEHLKSISATTDTDSQRKQFKPYSEEIISLARSLDQPVNTLYVQHCPMADGNKGANWLSLEKEIRNPYFGDKMLQCGKVTAQIQ